MSFEAISCWSSRHTSCQCAHSTSYLGVRFAMLALGAVCSAQAMVLRS
jgi:hypothetical protein